jgi:hypothetical protein
MERTRNILEISRIAKRGILRLKEFENEMENLTSLQYRVVESYYCALKKKPEVSFDPVKSL